MDPAVNSPQTQWKPLVICPNPPMAVRIRTALTELGVEEVSHLPQYPQIGEIGSLLQRHACHVCFLDVASNPDLALLLISEAAASVPVVALNPRNDADLILRCLRRGASEFVSDATSEQIGGVLERLLRLHAPAAPVSTATVYCVLPGKAGSGASTIAAYFAIELKRCGVGKVLLVDTDCLIGSIGFLLKLKSDFHFGDAARDSGRIDEDLWTRMVASAHGIDVLPAPQNSATDVALDRQSAFELLRFWRRHYDAIVLDLPGAHSAGFEFAALSDEILLVSTNDLAALHGTKRSMERLEKASVDSARLKLIVTRYAASSGLKSEDMQTALKLEPYSLLSNDCEAVQIAALDGRPIVPGSSFGKSIHALAEKLLGREKVVKKRSPFFGLLNSRK